MGKGSVHRRYCTRWSAAALAALCHPSLFSHIARRKNYRRGPNDIVHRFGMRYPLHPVTSQVIEQADYAMSLGDAVEHRFAI
jgi:hypothetical protein